MEITTIKTTENSKAARGDRASCTINALSVTAEIPFEIAQQIGAKAGRRRGSGFQPRKLLSVAKRYGVVSKKLRFKRMTLQKFIKQHPVGKFYVATRVHAFAVIDGVVNDWRDNPAMCILVEGYEITSQGLNDKPIKVKEKKPLAKWNRLADEYIVKFINRHGDCNDLHIFDKKGVAFKFARGEKKLTSVIVAVWHCNFGEDKKDKIIYTRGKKLWLKKGGWL